jgi:hypothetical protein
MSVTILEALADPNIFAPHFRNSGTWNGWSAFNAALFGLPMTAEQALIYRACTGREEVPHERADEAWLVVGRRGGKSRMLALVAAYLASFVDWRPYLAPGERGDSVVIAADRRQCRTIMGYIRAFLLTTELLAGLVERDTAEEVELSNGLTIEVASCSFRTIRGRTVIAALCDEAAFWADDDGANPASEVILSLRPAMATIPGAMLLVASSPYWKRGPLWDAFKRYFGKCGKVLVWRADTRTMNPAVTQSIIDEAYERDEISARSEYGAEFRSDLDTFIGREVIDALVVPARYELPPMNGTSYAAFVDPSGGSADSMTLAIAHNSEDDKGVLDAVREWRPPFSPDNVVGECAALLRTYGVTEVEGDRYAGEWPRERFSVHGITYTPCARVKSDIYRDLLPILNSARCELLDNQRLAAQLCSLERRTARGGRDSIDHGPGGHDDLANAAAGALVMVGGELSLVEVWDRFGARVRGETFERNR